MGELIIYGFIFLFGLCVGSFLNALIYRLPRSLPITGRSFCPNCKKKILWQDNIPLLSFLLLRGKCRFCHSSISVQYPLVELATGAVTALLVYHILIYDILAGIYYLLITWALIVIFFTDLRYQVVPDQVIYPIIAIAFVFSLITNYQLLITFLLSALAAAGFFLLLHLLTRRQGMGMGDVKLAFLMGLILGFPKIIPALYLAFLTGALVGVILVLTGKKKFGQPLPFGPFLTSATVATLLWGEAILKWTTAQFF